ncbi:hypothetical protein CDL15_Pgr028591 [Punica granatum]|uniref:DUF1639 family protein n=1 Tax=Punica granatum TaxID=22663 RepID=A0A218VWC2_PUNGR|nr:hypothetical protein CDL15_Pgr028591 [Punica granatum]
MVFQSISESEPPARTVQSVPMASIVSAKSHQPLHNFSLTDLKWSQAHHRFCRQPAESGHHSPPCDSASQVLNCAPSSSSRNAVEARDVKVKDDPAVIVGNGRSSKILLRFRAREKPRQSAAEAEAEEEAEEEEAAVALGKALAGPAEPEGLTSKVWNLRPRKQITKKSSTSQITAPEMIGGLVEVARVRTGGAEVETAGAEERKLKVIVPLTKEEIQADFLAMTGSRPPRRPKKRPRTVQRALDYVFPGLWLSTITPDSYKVVDKPPKVLILKP